MEKLLFLTILLFSFSCSFAPLTSDKTARPLGTGKWMIDTGLSPLPNISVGRGFTKKLDAGLVFEEQVFPVVGAWGKYSFITNSSKGISMAGFGGVFQALDIGTSHGFYLGPIFSYMMGKFEPYVIARYNYVKWDGNEISSDERDDLMIDLIRWDDITLQYMQYTAGFNIWFSKKFALNLNMKYFSFFGDNIDSNDDSSFVPGGALIFRF